MDLFVSSPYSGLEDERQAVAQRLEAEHSIVGMEEFGSSGLAPIETCLEALQTCDASILILGPRYGSRVEESDMSYTEAEYEYARANGIRVFAYVVEDFERLIDEVDQSDDDKERQRSFKAVVEGELTVDQSYFSSPQTLADAVARDVERWLERPRRPRFRGGGVTAAGSLPYASTRITRAWGQLFPQPVVLVDVGSAHLQSYPPATSSRVARKLHEIYEDLAPKGLQILIFNDLPVTENQLESEFEQRLASLIASEAIVVCIVRRDGEFDRLKRFSEAGKDRALWAGDWLDLNPGDFAPSFTSRFSGDHLASCSVALAIEDYIERKVNELTLERVIASRQ